MKKKILLVVALIAVIAIYKVSRKETTPEIVEEKKAIEKAVLPPTKEIKKEEQTHDTHTEQIATYIPIDDKFISDSFKKSTLKFISSGDYSIARNIQACPKSLYKKSFGKRVMDNGAVTYFLNEISESDLLHVKENTFPVLINRQNDGLAYLTGGFTVEIMKGESINDVIDQLPLQLKYHLKGTQTYYLHCGQCNIEEVSKSLSENEIVLEATTEIVQFQDKLI